MCIYFGYKKKINYVLSIKQIRNEKKPDMSKIRSYIVSFRVMLTKVFAVKVVIPIF